MSSFDGISFQRFIEHDNFSTRERLKELGKDPLFDPRYNIQLNDQRELALQRLKKVAEAKAVSIRDFQSNPQNIFAAHEVLGYLDGSLATKFTVQFNLFGGSVFALSTERHSSLLSKIDDLSIVGCFCLTELGYGNNAIEMETTATYDPATKEFLINSPTTRSQKYWITNGACHARYATVFAQTIVNGQNEGIHVFLTKIREEDLSLSKGVFIEDMGLKMECNGVDNARIAFNNVRIPYTNLLNKYSDIDPVAGKLVSSISKRRQRFLKVADRLLSGRLCIASMMVGAMKMGLLITLIFAKNRYGVGPDGKSSSPIIDYQLQKLALIPLLAQGLSLIVGLNRIKDLYADPNVIDEDKVRLCCAIKALVSWHSEKIGSVCRERCGGQGYLSVNRISSIIGFSHSAMTAEGDNSVLMQKVSKELLSDLQSGKISLPVAKKNKSQLLALTDFYDILSLRDFLVHREIAFVEKLQNTLATGVSKGKTVFKVWMEEASNTIQTLARTYGERVVADSCILSLNDPDAQSNRLLLQKLFALNNLMLIQRDLAWYVINGIISHTNAENIEGLISNLVEEIVPFSVDIVRHLGIPDYLIKAPIAADYIKYNESSNKGEYKAVPKL